MRSLELKWWWDPISHCTLTVPTPHHTTPTLHPPPRPQPDPYRLQLSTTDKPLTTLITACSFHRCSVCVGESHLCAWECKKIQMWVTEFVCVQRGIEVGVCTVRLCAHPILWNVLSGRVGKVEQFMCAQLCHLSHLCVPAVCVSVCVFTTLTSFALSRTIANYTSSLPRAS